MSERHGSDTLQGSIDCPDFPYVSGFARFSKKNMKLTPYAPTLMTLYIQSCDDSIMLENSNTANLSPIRAETPHEYCQYCTQRSYLVLVTA